MSKLIEGEIAIKHFELKLIYLQNKQSKTSNDYEMFELQQKQLQQAYDKMYKLSKDWLLDKVTVTI